MTTKERISVLLKELNKGIYEKEEVMALALLSSIAGESIFLLGPPGVAKSLIARRLKYAYKDGKAFEYLMSRFSTPDEIFGPVSISKLKNEDKYERKVEGYLPSATVVFLDEIWKAGPSIQNALLTVLNEKKFRNGDTEIDVPMKALISASNELPAKDEGLEALWDRFLVRLVVECIENEESFDKMISEDLHSFDDPAAEGNNKITDEEYKTWDTDIKKIKIPENVFNVIHVIRAYLADYNQREDNADKQIYISDRRWRKIVRLLRASAFLNDRDEVDLMDCFLIRYCIWNEETERDTVYQFVQDAVEKHGYMVSLDISDIEKELKDIDDDVKKWTEGEKPVEYQVPKLHNKRFYKIKTNDSDYLFISKDDMEKANETDFSEIILNLSADGRQYDTQNEFLKKSPNENKILIKGSSGEEEFDIECTSEICKELHPYIKPAHSGAIKEWDKRIKTVQTKAGNLKSQIESYRVHDLKHIRVNLFVDKKYADSVERNLNDLEKEIEKCEIEANRIHGCYHNIEPPKDSSETKLLEESE
jgi:MoxR-like ATPase